MLLKHQEMFGVGGCTDDWQRSYMVFKIALTVHRHALSCIALSMSNSCAVDAQLVGGYWLILIIFAAVGRFYCQGPCRGVAVPINMAFMFTLSWLCQY